MLFFFDKREAQGVQVEETRGEFGSVGGVPNGHHGKPKVLGM